MRDSEGRCFVPETDLDYHSELLDFIRSREKIQLTFPTEAGRNCFKYRAHIQSLLSNILCRNASYVTYVDSGNKFSTYELVNQEGHKIAVKFLRPRQDLSDGESETKSAASRRFNRYKSEHGKVAKYFETMVPHSEFIEFQLPEFERVIHNVPLAYPVLPYAMVSEFVPGMSFGIASAAGIMTREQVEDFIERYDEMSEQEGRVLDCINLNTKNVLLSMQTGRIGIVDTNHLRRPTDFKRNGFLRKMTGGVNTFRIHLAQLLRELE